MPLKPTAPSFVPLNPAVPSFVPMTTMAPIAPKRKMVTVRCIVRMEEVEGAPDYVELNFEACSWPVLIPKTDDMPKINDLVLFFELDSFLPKSDPRFASLFASPTDPITTYQGREGHRVKTTMKGLRASQGIIFPLSDFPEIMAFYGALVSQLGLEEATASLLTNSFDALLGVDKWEPTPLTTIPGKTLGLCPGFIPQPTWPRAQNIVADLFHAHHLHKKLWQISEKLDGTTMHIYKLTGPTTPTEIGVCSRTHNFVNSPSNLYWATAHSSSILAKIHAIPHPNIVIQGELVGSMIEHNSMNYPPNTHEFIVFAIWDLDQRCYMDPLSVENMCHELGIAHAKVLDYATIGKHASNIDELLQFAHRTGKFGAAREGLVFKSLDGEGAFKIISNQWLNVTGK